MSTALQLERLGVSYGGVRALDGVDLTVRDGQLVGLIGPNGAGKTTLIDAATGYTAASGRVLLRGDDVSSLRPYLRARQGMTRTWQSVELFEDLSVYENLEVSTGRQGFGDAVREIFNGRRRPSTGADKALAAVGLDGLTERAPSELSLGQRKLVGVARALASSPAIVCLDEPAAGLDSEESAVLGAQLRAVVDQGLAMLLVDHDMGLVLSVCDYIYVLDFGKLIAAGVPDDIRRNAAVVEAYLGRAAADAEAAAAREGREVPQ
jgi:branched-chain amino acid transport system ATP-binding protein